MNGYSYSTMLIKVIKAKVTFTVRRKTGRFLFNVHLFSQKTDKLSGGVRKGLEKITKHIRRLLDKPQK